MSEELIINKIPAKTWNLLDVNETKINWEKDKENEPARNLIITAPENGTVCERLDFNEKESYVTVNINVDAKYNSNVNLFVNTAGNNNTRLYIKINSAEKSTTKLIISNLSGAGSVVYVDAVNELKGEAELSIIQIIAGRADYYSNLETTLLGDDSSVAIDTGYIATDKQRIDMNVVVNHKGMRTVSDINSGGSLSDEAYKCFKGTIDFKKGSKDAVGNEQENVLLLGDDIVNKSVPVILCEEENVVGNHGASLGQMDEDTYFYFGNRGIDRQTADKMMSRAALYRVVALADDPVTAKAVATLIDEL